MRRIIKIFLDSTKALLYNRKESIPIRKEEREVKALVFSSLIFLFAYLTLTVLLYFIVPRSWRNVVLFIVSLAFYGWGEPLYILVMLFSICVAYGFGFPISYYRERNPKRAKIFLAVSVCLNLALLLFFKYTNFFLENLALIPLFSAVKPIEGLSLPIGISFYTFQIMSYSIDLYRGQTDVQKNFIAFGTYVTLFPQLIAGPIVRYRDVDDQLTERAENAEKFASGIERFCVGLGKKVLLGDSMAALYTYFKTAAEFEGSVLGAWMIVLCFTLHIYYDFSGYSDMAIGLGRMFGFEFRKNFDIPYVSKSVTEFWRRWHISLGSWFRDYVYIPLGGNRCKGARHIFNLFVVWALTGLWHGASWNFVFWGLFYFVLLVLEKFVFKNIDKLPKILGHIYTFSLVTFGFIIFYFTDTSALVEAIKTLFGAHGFGNLSVFNHYQIIRVRTILVFILAIFACTPVFKNMLDKKNKMSDIIILVLFILSIVGILASSYNPFIYFRF